MNGLNDFFAWATKERKAIALKGDVPGHEFHGNQYTGGGGGGSSGESILTGGKDIAEKLADKYEKEYGFDETHTREGFIKNKMKQLKDNEASPEFKSKASDSIQFAIKDGYAGSDVDYIILKSGESGYEGGQYDKSLGAVFIYESAMGGDKQSLGDASNISSTFDNEISGTVAHEYGHHYAESLHPNVETRARAKLENATPEEKKFIKSKISYYAATSPIELAAEAYAMSKHPDFDKQPKEVKSFVRGILVE